MDGEPVEDDCGTCNLLECGTACCTTVGYFAAQNSPAYMERPDLIDNYMASDGNAELTATFDGANQFAAISFDLASATTVSPSAFHVYASHTSGVTLTASLENGAAGCVYDTDASGYLYTTPYNCWESFTTSSPVSKINVRIESLGAGSGYLDVYNGSGVGALTW